MTVALNRFISKFVDKCRPFFQLLKKWKDFEWMEECQWAFSELKAYLAQAPILSQPVAIEILYMAMTNHTMNAVLI